MGFWNWVISYLKSQDPVKVSSEMVLNPVVWRHKNYLNILLQLIRMRGRWQGKIVGDQSICGGQFIKDNDNYNDHGIK